MAEALVLLLIEHLGSITLECIEQEVRLVKGVEKDVTKLKTNLEDIQVLLEDAEEKQVNDAGVRRWLEKLKNVSNYMDDVLDEWSTSILEYKIKKEEAAENYAFLPKTKVCFPVPSSCFCFTEVSTLSLRRDIAEKIKELNIALERIAKEKKMYNLNIKGVVERPKRPQSICLVDETKVYGREKDKSLLISRLICETSTDEGRGLDIVPLVGMGGLGKTTLAQLAYKDEAVKAHFDKQIWVCVSDPFEEVKIAKAIIEGLGVNVPSSVELNALVQCIQESIEGKRFLLVLDDVWLESYSTWEILQEPLKNGALGSKILVTTRKQEVAMMMGAAMRQITLEKLSEEHCWLVFSHLAFTGRTADERAQLENIGRRIAVKSSGLPLVAKTLGSLMRFKKTVSQWEDILNSKLWESNDARMKEIFAPFLLSYFDLPPREKRCFLYCSIFPKGTCIKRDELIEMWMSQCYLGSTMNSRKEGLDCFENLTMRSFFQDFDEDLSSGNIVFKMHDIVHDFSQFLTKKEFILMEVGGVEEKMKPVDEMTRHLTLDAAILRPNFRCGTKNLRTLYIKSDTYHRLPVHVLPFPHLTRLRTLNLSRCWLDNLPEDVGNLKHLRYLDLSDNQLKGLPDALFDLCNLQTLKLCYCRSLQRLPEKIVRLVSLRHLYIEGCPFEGLPKGIGRLTGLRTLDMVVVPEYREPYLDLGDLKDLNNLRFDGVLSVNRCANVTNIEHAEKIMLKTREQLAVLALRFRAKEEMEYDLYLGHSFIDDITILEGLQPHPNLKTLSISYYLGGTMVPRWMMSLVNLRRLEFNNCISCEDLPPLGKMPSLESIFIEGMSSMETVGQEFLGITEKEGENGVTGREEPLTKSSIILFPRLKQLSFDFNWKWKAWEGPATTINHQRVTIMPCLHSLRIYGCSSLEALPDFLQTTPLQNLCISGSKLLKRQCQKERGKEWFKISHVPNIEMDGKYVQRDGIWIQKS